MPRRLNITARPQSRDELADWYAAALDEQAGSGLTVTEYAEEIGVAAATLYQWRRRLAVDAEDYRGAPQRPMGLVEVELGTAPTSASSSSGYGPRNERVGTFTVRLDRGRGIEVPREFDDAELRRLVTVLESC